MNNSKIKYNNLHQISRHTQILNGVLSLINWDQETYMPTGSSGIRAEQQAALAGIIHKEKTGKPFKDALSKLVNLKTGKIIAKGLSQEQMAALREWYRDYRQENSLPLAFVEEFTKLCSQAIEVWRSARDDNAFQRFAPYLDRIISMNRKKADLLGYDESPYDPLLDLHEPEMTTRETELLFASLRPEIQGLLKKILKAKQIDDRCIHGKFDPKKQLEFGEVILKSMGYEMQHGRLDLSTHPFSSSQHPTDSRITTRIHPTSIINNISTVLHEGGHSLYDMGLPAKHYGSPLGSPVSYGIHESQSRWWETRIGQSKAFWQHFLPLLKKTFKGKLEKATVGDFYKAVNKVEPSFIRVDADEVTYNLHVIIRFELEKDLIEGRLKVREIPEAWNAKMKDYLGIVPKTYAEGCLQDVHWALGAFGYFPSYTLGNLFAAHFFEAFEHKNPQWESRVARGDLEFIKEWLRINIHQHGRRYTSKELLKKVNGRAFSEKAFVKYLKTKYQNIYNL